MHKKYFLSLNASKIFQKRKMTKPHLDRKIETQKQNKSSQTTKSMRILKWNQQNETRYFFTTVTNAANGVF